MRTESACRSVLRLGSLRLGSLFVEVGGFNDFRGDEVRGADYGWWVFAGHNEAIDVDEAGLPRGRVNQAVFVAEVAVRKPCHVHAAHGAGEHGCRL